MSLSWGSGNWMDDGGGLKFTPFAASLIVDTVKKLPTGTESEKVPPCPTSMSGRFSKTTGDTISKLEYHTDSCAGAFIEASSLNVTSSDDTLKFGKWGRVQGACDSSIFTTVSVKSEVAGSTSVA